MQRCCHTAAPHGEARARARVTCGASGQKQTLIADGQSRRALLLGLPAAVLPLVGACSAQAADVTSLLTKLIPMQPEPVMYPRRALDQRFAVLLLRSGYDAVDALDFIPMDNFQRIFWKLRQSEQEPYNFQYDPLKPRVGDLTDPLYFDFISFAQNATIAQEMPRGRAVFEEFCEECPDNKRLVRRDASISNDALPAAYFEAVGDKIYDGLRHGFREEVFDAPEPCGRGASLAAVTAALQRILDIMSDKGFAIKAAVKDVEAEAGGASGAFTVSLTGAANQWALQALAARRLPLLNAYDAMVVSAYLRASGWSGRHEVEVTPGGCETRWTVARL